LGAISIKALGLGFTKHPSFYLKDYDVKTQNIAIIIVSNYFGNRLFNTQQKRL